MENTPRGATSLLSISQQPRAGTEVALDAAVSVQQLRARSGPSLLPRRELKVKADFIHCVYSTVLLGHRRGRGFCSLARGCQGRWFLSHWHPLMEENTGRILLLRHKIRGVFLKRSSISFQASARLLLVCPLKCHCLNLSHWPGCAGLCFGREKDA